MKKIFILFALILSLASCEHKTFVPVVDGFETVDSVWFTEPGNPHTLQTDFIWYGKTSSGIVVSKRNTKVSVGDTVWIVKGVKRLL